MTPIDARRAITQLTERPYTNPHPYRETDIYDLSQEIYRDLLIDHESDPISPDDYNGPDTTPRMIAGLSYVDRTLREALTVLHADPYSRHWLSMQYLENSLCPVHHIDYAICFDDQDPECALIREYFPSHDT